MSNEDTIKLFYSFYQKHEYKGMQSLLNANVKFSDYALDISGKAVFAMWHWFCVPFEARQEPMEVPSFEILGSDNNRVLGKYRVIYKLRDEKNETVRTVDYVIESNFTLEDGKIKIHTDKITISELAFARMVAGFPKCLLAFTPIFQKKVKEDISTKLSKFMHVHKSIYEVKPN